MAGDQRWFVEKVGATSEKDTDVVEWVEHCSGETEHSHPARGSKVAVLGVARATSSWAFAVPLCIFGFSLHVAAMCKCPECLSVFVSVRIFKFLKLVKILKRGFTACKACFFDLCLFFFVLLSSLCCPDVRHEVWAGRGFQHCVSRVPQWPTEL